MKAIRSLTDRLSAQVAQVRLPRLGREVALPVYIIHNSPDVEDYFFIFDFEAFVEQSRAGRFVRPKLKLWAGRSDFSRRAFARAFRESFAREFDLAQEELAAQQAAGEARGWFGGLSRFFAGIAAPSLPGMVANLVLLVALSAGHKLLRQLLPRAWLQAKTDRQKLEEGIEETREKVDAALERIDITLHIELYRHAWRGQQPGRLTGLDYEAWPLPAYVRAHLHDGASGAWW